MEWKSIKGYDGLYEVSSHGEIRSVTRVRNFGKATRVFKGKLLKPQKDKDGYLKNALSKDGAKKMFFVHRLVAINFISNDKDLPVVNHIDGNKQNNNVKNLEWVTRSENDLHAFKNNLRVATDGGTSKAVLQYDKNNNFIKEFKSISEASREVGVSPQMISYVCNGKSKTANNFVWKFKV